MEPLKPFKQEGFPPEKSTKDMALKVPELNGGLSNTIEKLITQNRAEEEGYGIFVGDSPLHGKGMFTSKKNEADVVLTLDCRRGYWRGWRFSYDY